MITAKEVKEKQAQLRSDELLSEQYLARIKEKIEYTIKHTNTNYIEYYETTNAITVLKLKELGFSIDICSWEYKGGYVAKGIKISW
jgi:hypothetical protein